MLTKGISLGYGAADPVFEVFVQRLNKGLFHTGVSAADFIPGKGIGTTAYSDDELFFRELFDLPVVANHIKYLEKILAYLCYAFEIASLLQVHADAGAVFSAYIPDQIEPIVTEPLKDGIIEVAKTLHITWHGTVVFMFEAESFK